VARHTLDDFEPDAPFDAVVLLSAIEHFGLGAYTDDGELDDDADLNAMKRVRDLLVPGGRVVLTTPFGPAAVDELERTYDEERLRRLFEGFEIEQALVGSRMDDTTWSVTGSELTTPAAPGHVAMVRARRP
jgi:cyclopropane fatty-acyl-phospholipid synthase-like methyltransferase